MDSSGGKPTATPKGPGRLPIRNDRGPLFPLLAAIILVLPLVIMPWATPARADELEEAFQLYSRGDFLAASNAAAKLGTARGYGLAARGRLVHAMLYLRDKELIRALDAAFILAKKGLEIEPGHIDSHLQAASALGLKARAKGSGSLGRKSLRHIKAVLAVNNDEPKALAALGGWHGEVIKRAGRFFGRLLFGARRRSVFLNFDRAIKLAPGIPSFRIAYAKTLLSFGDKFRPRAISLLRQAAALPAPDRLEEIIQEHAALILTAIREGDEERLEALLENISAAAHGG